MSHSSIEQVEELKVMYVRGASPKYLLEKLNDVKKPFKIIAAYALNNRHYMVIEVQEKKK